MRESTPAWLQRNLAWAARAVAATRAALRGLLERRGRQWGDSSGATRVAVTDGGEEFPVADAPEETAFIWGQTRDEPSEHEPETNGSPEAEIEAIDDRIDDLAERADHLSILAMNVNLKLARGETGDLASIAYDVEAEARGLRRTIEDVEYRVDQLHDRIQDSPGVQPGPEGVDRDSVGGWPGGDSSDRGDVDGEVPDGERGVGEAPDGEDGDDEYVLGGTDAMPPGTSGRDRELAGRSSTQLPAGDRQLNEPWRTAGVDLTNWPGHLARLDFDRIKEQVTRSETVATGTVPPAVADFSLDDGELSFEALLSLAAASGLGQRTANDDVPSDEED